MTHTSGKPYMAVVLQVSHHDDGSGTPRAIDPVNRTLSLWMTDAAWEHTRDKLKALGFHGDFEKPQFTLPADGVWLTMSHETYNGKEREKWELASWGDKQAGDALGHDLAIRFSARYRTETNLTPKPAGKPATPDRGANKAGPVAAAVGPDGREEPPF